MVFLKKILLFITLFALVSGGFSSTGVARGEPVFDPQNPQNPVLAFLPLLFKAGPTQSLFGIETTYIDQNLLNKAQAIPTYWWRYNAFLWNQIEPVDVNPNQYNWGAVDDNSLIAASQQGFTIIAVVKNTPFFAQKINKPQNIPCSPIKDDPATKAEFREFIHELAVRYSAAPFNIRYWQMGNEPDVDPDLFLPQDLPTTPFGCWGDDTDPYYGGRYYAEILQIFSEEIKAVNPSAQITNGGLLLDCHPDIDVGCASGTFFEGILRYLQQAAAFSALDYVSFHAYARWYGDLRFDEDHKGFTANGGVLLGKSYFLRQVMTSFGINPLKPLLVTEGGTMCARPDDAPVPLPSGKKCSDVDAPPEFDDDQAEHLVWMYVRAAADDIAGLMWYTLNYQNYRHVGLMDSSNNPKPAYYAYQFLVSLLGDAQVVGKLNQYYPTLRAYEFIKNTQHIWVLWSPDQDDHDIFLPAGFQAAYDKFGTQIVLPPGAITITINSPVYLVLD